MSSCIQKKLLLPQKSCIIPPSLWDSLHLSNFCVRSGTIRYGICTVRLVPNLIHIKVMLCHAFCLTINLKSADPHNYNRLLYLVSAATKAHSYWLRWCWISKHLGMRIMAYIFFNLFFRRVSASEGQLPFSYML